MGRSSQFTVAVSGGDTEENQKIASVIADSLRCYGFGNVFLDASESVHLSSQPSVFDAIHSANPDLFSAPISICADRSGDSYSLESRAISDMVRTAISGPTITMQPPALRM